MSSATKPSVLRSSSLRLAVLLALVIWVVSAGIIVAVVAASERALLRPLNDAVIEDLEFFVEQLDNSEFELFDWYGDELEDAFVETEDIEGDEPEAFLEEYIERLREAPGGSARRRASIQARLWLLRETNAAGEIDRPVEYYQRLIFEEVPDRWHDWLLGQWHERVDLLHQ